MKYEEILDSIKKANNQYEDQRGITTDFLKEIYSNNEIALILGYKSDNTKTLFLAYKSGVRNDYWFWWCISDGQMKFLTKKLGEMYKNLNESNQNTKSI